MDILLCCEFFFPSTGGSQKVIEEIAKNLIIQGNKITIATTFIKNRKKIESIQLKEFKISGNLVNGFSGNIDKYKTFIRDSKYDVILFYAAQQWTFDLALDLLDNINSKLIFCPCGYSGLKDKKYQKYFDTLSKKLKIFYKCVYHGREYQDYEFGLKFSPNNIAVIENAASDEFNTISNNNFKNKYNIQDLMILNTANYSFMKGQDISLLIFLLSKVKGTLVFIGNNNLRFSNLYFCFLYIFKFLINTFFRYKKIIFLKQIPRKEVIEAFLDADIFLFTSRLECSPLVIFESSASETAFISRDVGNTKEISKWTNAGFVSNNLRALVNYLNLLYVDNNKRLIMARNGRKSFIDRFNWKKVTYKYLDIMRG